MSELTNRTNKVWDEWSIGDRITKLVHEADVSAEGTIPLAKLSWTELKEQHPQLAALMDQIITSQVLKEMEEDP